jgi:glycine cleavage system H protein
MPTVGAKVEKGKTFGSVESVKAVSDLYAPVSGEVSDVNEDLGSAPETINTDPHGAWIMRVTLSDPSEVDSLMSAADYETFVAEESGH